MELIRTIWKSNLGKVFLGGCGTQVGMGCALVALAGTLLFCSVCAFSSVLSVAVMQEIASPPTYVVAEAAPEAPSNGEVEILRTEVESLVVRVESLQANEPVVPAPAVAPPPLPKPFVIVSRNGITLRSGPGTGYRRIGVSTPGSRYHIVGRNVDSSWWLISTPDGLAWVSAKVVTAYDLNDEIPVLTIPVLLSWRSGDPPAASTPVPNAAADPSSNLPIGTPTATAAEGRIFVEDTVGYQQILWQLRTQPASASFSPKGDQIVVTEGVKLYLVADDATDGRILLAEDGVLRPVGGAVWSPDGEYIAFVADYLNPKCKPCRSVGLVRLSDETIFFLQTPDNLDGDTPRWTQDGRLLISVHPGEPADGTTYIYDLSGRGQVASGTYVLSSSHDGQRWSPWRPGRTWRAGVSERPDAYYSD